jgi:hypothetical protein
MIGFRDCVLWLTFVVINGLLIVETRRYTQKKVNLVVNRTNLDAALPTRAGSNMTGHARRGRQKGGKAQRSDAEKVEMRITIIYHHVDGH